MINLETRLVDTATYLAIIDAPDPIVARVRELLDSYSRIIDLREADVFVNDVIDPDGNRIFPSLWVFTPQAALEARLSAEGGVSQLDGTSIRHRVVHWVARTEDFDFETASPTSRATIEVWFPDEILGELKATGANCERLAEVLKKHIVTNWGA